MVEAGRRSIEVNSSVMNLFDRSTLYTAFWPVEGIVRRMRQAGYDGLEWHPIRFPIVSGVEMNIGKVDLRATARIRSLHQSYRSEKSLKEAWNHPNRQLAVASYVALPERAASVNDLQRLQRMLGRSMPAVLYPSQPGERSVTDRHFGEKLFQPTAEVMHRWGAANLGQLWAEARNRGFDGYALDLFHMRSTHEGVTLGPWQDALPQLLEHTKEIQVSAGRVDIMQDEIDTRMELSGLVEGEGEMADILRGVKNLDWSGRVVTEIPAKSLTRLHGQKKLSERMLLSDHGRIVRAIKGILS